jgi:DeoR family transcriptional regulator, aga operon transcriptional repressor
VTLGSRSVVLQRRLKIADWIRRHGVTRVDALTEALGVSAVTIRGDLTYLEDQGLVVRQSGKARPGPSPPGAALPANGLSRSEARPMVRLAAGLVDGTATLLLGPGRLTTHLVAELPARADLGIIVTSLEALSVAKQCLDGAVYLLGGRLGADGVSIDGPQAVHALSFHVIDMFFVQAEAITRGAVLLPPGAFEPFHQAALQRARQTVVLVNGKPPGSTASLQRLPLAAVDHVILAPDAGPGTSRALAEAGFRQQSRPEPSAQLHSKSKITNEAISP